MKENSDYRKGLNLLKTILYKNHDYETYFNILNKSWVFKLSEILAEFNACEKFWINTIKQNRLKNINHIKSLESVFWNSYTLFVWGKTEEGIAFWSNLADKVLKRWQGKGYSFS